MSNAPRNSTGKQSKHRRRVVRLEDFTEEEIALIARAEPRPEDARLDAELDDWSP